MLLPRIVGNHALAPGGAELLGALRVGEQGGDSVCERYDIGFGHWQTFLLMAHDVVERRNIAGDVPAKLLPYIHGF
jgi:hypothetical protein